MKNFLISLPSTETLSKFQNIIKPIFEKVLATQREIKQLETLRDTLLPKLMNGEIGGISMEYNWDSMFENSYINFTIYNEPVSLQNKEEKKRKLREIIHLITKKCPYIITSHCWVHIEYRCNNIKRIKNLSSYDMDNLIKPILDSLVGIDGIILDDSLFNSVEINWQDKNGDDEFEIQIEYTEFLYSDKSNLFFFKHGQWCFPMDSIKQDFRDLIQYFERWGKILSEDDYYENIKLLPCQPFLPYNKICKSGFKFVEI